MDLRKCKLDEIVWSSKHKSTSKADITVTKCKDGSIAFTFRNDVFGNITRTGYIQVGVLGYALIFREAEPHVGHKGCFKKSSRNYHTHIEDSSIREWAEKYAGDYTARLFREYIYIDAEAKAKQEGSND